MRGLTLKSRIGIQANLEEMENPQQTNKQTNAVGNSETNPSATAGRTYLFH